MFVAIAIGFVLLGALVDYIAWIARGRLRFSVESANQARRTALVLALIVAVLGVALAAWAEGLDTEEPVQLSTLPGSGLEVSGGILTPVALVGSVLAFFATGFLLAAGLWAGRRVDSAL